MKKEKGYQKVPVVMQMEALECGAACLTMILAYFGRWVPLEKVRLDCGVSRDGASAKNILKAGRAYGLQAKGVRYEPEGLKENGIFPCIIHWNFNHFVVFAGFKGKKAVINDPARGVVLVSEEEFDKSFTGVCLMFEPSEEFQPGGKQASILAYAKKRLKGTGFAFLFVLMTTIIVSLLGIIQPAFQRVFMDRLLTEVNPGWFYPFLIGFGLLAVIQIIVALVKSIYLRKIEGKMAVVANSTYVWHILRLPMEFYSQRLAGDILGRQATNETIASSLINQMTPLVLDSAMMIFYFAVMLRYNVAMTVVGVISIVLNLFLARYISQKRINIARVSNKANGKLKSTTIAGISMIETIKSSGAENGFFAKWAGYQAGVNQQEVKSAYLNTYIGMIPTFVASLADMVVLAMGVYLVMQGEFTIGMITAFQGFMLQVTGPATRLIQFGQQLQEMRTDMERIEDVLGYEPDVKYDKSESSADESYSKLSGDIQMKHISFGYSRLEEPLIEDFSMTLKPGSRVAFVGGSGSGKSTLAKLLSGLYEPWSGEILFDGRDKHDIDHSVFTGSVAVVDQDITLFEDTIANNIKMWDASIEDFEMILAARDAKIHEDIMKREGGYQYCMLEGGKDFSGGQRQRLEIARVLAQDPTIVIMDEATSALDAKTEYELLDNVKQRSITCVIIAHRLSTIRDCDEIIVLQQGQVMERGTHEELYANQGLYHQLVTYE